MTLTDELKILDDKFKANQAQYDLDREAAKISALSSKELDKYEYLTGEDLGYKPGVVEPAKFEYSALGKVFNKGLDEKDKKEGLLKRLNNIEGKNEEQVETIKNEHLMLVKRLIDDKPKLKGLRYQIDKRDKEQLKYFDDFMKLETSIDYTKLYYQSCNKNKDAFNFNQFGLMVDFYQRLRPGPISFIEANSKLIRFSGLLDMLKNKIAHKKL